MTARPPYLVPVTDGAQLPAPPRPARMRVTAWQRAEIEDARHLVMQTPELLDAKPHAYVAGRLEGAAANLLDILDAITEIGGEPG
jgi:hypothetical protein